MLVFALAFALWAIVHSLTAGPAVKSWFRGAFGQRAYEGLFRPLYNVVSTVTFLLFLAATAALIPERLLWSVPMPARLLNYAVQVIGLAGLAYSLWQTDIWRFAGIRQFVAYLRGAEHPEGPDAFIETGTYALVRHPLYLFSLLVLWASPVITLRSAVLNLLVTAYFLIGSVYEERKLAAAFGDDYRRYQERVPRLLPLRLPSRRARTNDPA
jgi:protein-S-isoprenylcysteine O-methyltransferase Ste14